MVAVDVHKSDQGSESGVGDQNEELPPVLVDREEPSILESDSSSAVTIASSNAANNNGRDSERSSVDSQLNVKESELFGDPAFLKIVEQLRIPPIELSEKDRLDILASLESRFGHLQDKNYNSDAYSDDSDDDELIRILLGKGVNINEKKTEKQTRKASAHNLNLSGTGVQSIAAECSSVDGSGAGSSRGIRSEATLLHSSGGGKCHRSSSTKYIPEVESTETESDDDDRHGEISERAVADASGKVLLENSPSTTPSSSSAGAGAASSDNFKSASSKAEVGVRVVGSSSHQHPRPAAVAEEEKGPEVIVISSSSSDEDPEVIEINSTSSDEDEDFDSYDLGV